MVLAPITVKEHSSEDIEMIRLFKDALQRRMKRRYSLANVINLPLPKARGFSAPVENYDSLFAVPVFNQAAA
jgi:hypothetical protein